MPKEYFSRQSVTSLKSLPAGASIHVIGVAGVAMGQIAVALTELGYSVTGSDKDFYEPIGSYLRNSKVKLFQGYSSKNLNHKIDLVVIGNAVSYTNPEVLEVEEQKLPYSLFTQILQEILIIGKTSIVITGTHGKSTTTGLTAGILENLDLNPGYFIGGISKDLPKSLNLSEGKFCVIEGDEYDSAFFAKVPKFTFYLPDILVINAIEFDHADIYSDVSVIIEEFDKLILSTKDTAEILFCIDFPIVNELYLKYKDLKKCISFGFNPQADVLISDSTNIKLSQEFDLKINSEIKKIKINLTGEYNARNATAAIMASFKAGIDLDQAISTISKLKGVKRRQELRYEDKNLVVIEDFAHHPTAVFEAIKAIKSGFSGFNVVAVFEPRSNTSRKKVFQEDYIKAFNLADQVIISAVEKKEHDTDLLDVNELAEKIKLTVKQTEVSPNTESIIDSLKKLTGKNVILIMSNGSFGNLIEKYLLTFQ